MTSSLWELHRLSSVGFWVQTVITYKALYAIELNYLRNYQSPIASAHHVKLGIVGKFLVPSIKQSHFVELRKSVFCCACPLEEHFPRNLYGSHTGDVQKATENREWHLSLVMDCLSEYLWLLLFIVLAFKIIRCSESCGVG